MSGSMRVVSGTVFRLRCNACGSVFPHFVFSGEDDTETDGLCSATSCDKNEVVIVEAKPDEWRDLSEGVSSSIQRRLVMEMNRPDLKVIRLLRVERSEGPVSGASFLDYKKSYKPPVLVYSCACCDSGESVSVEEIVSDDFLKAGGKVTAVGNLSL